MLTEPRMPGLIMTWRKGWAHSRGTEPPTPVDGGYMITVGLRTHRTRHVLHTHSPKQLRKLSEDLDQPGQWIKIVGDRPYLRSALSARWRMDDDGHLMTTAFTDRTVSVPKGYELEVIREPNLSVARVYDQDGATAASARLGHIGHYGVVDRVATQSAHRRKGLGTLLMSALSNEAVSVGIRTGILVATNDGLALYRHLGWTREAEISGAYIEEPPL